MANKMSYKGSVNAGNNISVISFLIGSFAVVVRQEVGTAILYQLERFKCCFV